MRAGPVFLNLLQVGIPVMVRLLSALRSLSALDNMSHRQKNFRFMTVLSCGAQSVEIYTGEWPPLLQTKKRGGEGKNRRYRNNTVRTRGERTNKSRRKR
jgi:hypothetical protein